LDFIEKCRQFISIETSPSRGNLEAALFAKELAEKLDLRVDLQLENFQNLEQANIIIRPNSVGTEIPGSEFMFQNHLDTADSGPYGYWTKTDHNPFDAHIIEQKIYGLGTADVKLDFLCKLEALTKFKDKKGFSLPPVLVGTFGEEIGMQGALKLIRKNRVHAKMALIGEPSDLQLMTEGKGFASVEISIPFSEAELKYKEEHNLRESTTTQSKIFNGKAAHSSTPHLGDNAIKKMFEYMKQLPTGVAVMELDGGINFNTVASQAFLEMDYMTGVHFPMLDKINKIYNAIIDLEQNFLQYQDAKFTPSHPTLSIGLIRTSGTHIEMAGNCRIPPTVTQKIYEGWMNQLNQLCLSIGAHFKINDYKQPYCTDENSVFVKGCIHELKAMNLFNSLQTQSSTNEASLFSRVGVECISFGAGKREGNIHTPNENVAIEDLLSSTVFYQKIIERFCL
jgi:acetylornithine deacetylase/succinyl-diaminopimelate desuccinylase-like protein